jgi:hypothetical protein
MRGLGGFNMFTDSLEYAQPVVRNTSTEFIGISICSLDDTRKDLLVKNIRRAHRQALKDPRAETGNVPWDVRGQFNPNALLGEQTRCTQ